MTGTGIGLKKSDRTGPAGHDQSTGGPTGLKSRPVPDRPVTGTGSISVPNQHEEYWSSN